MADVVSVYKITMDIKKPTTHIVTPVIVQYDNVRLEVTVLDDGKPFDLTNVRDIEFSHQRPDGEVIVEAGTLEDAKIIYRYVGNEMDVPGNIKTSFSMINGDEKVSVRDFYVVVQKSLKEAQYLPGAPKVDRLQELVVSVETLSTMVQAIGVEANTQSEYAKEQGDYAKAQGERLENTEIEYTQRVNQFGERLDGVETDPTFKASVNTEEAQLGEELIDGEGWISVGWSGDYATGFKNTVGQVLPLTKPLANTGTKLYQVSFRVESPTPAGVPNASTDFTVTLGNSAPFVTYQGGGNFNYTFGIQSVSEGSLSFNPGPTFNGTIKNVSVKEIVGEVSPSLRIENADNSNVLEVRTTKSDLNNIFIGKESGKKNTTGRGNVSLGDNSLPNNTTGYWNSALGQEALKDNTTGSRNVALGYLALEQNISGDRNIAIGTFAMERNTHGRENVAIGADALWYNTTGIYNMALGHYALGANTTGEGNIGIGRVALNQNTTGRYNVAIGVGSMERSVATEGCVAVGRDSLKNNASANIVAIGSGSSLGNTTGSSNTSLGTSALRTNTTGSDNTAVGNSAGYGTTGVISRNVLVGNRAGYALTTGANNNVLIGANAGESLTTGANNILLGYNVQTANPTDSNVLNIGGLIRGNLSTNQGLGIGRVPTGLDATSVRLQIGADNKTGIIESVRRSTTNSTSLGELNFINDANNDADANTRKRSAYVSVRTVTTDGNADGDAGATLSVYAKGEGSALVESVVVSNLGIGIRGTAPTAQISLASGTAAANTAPIKFRQGSLNTTPEAGALEYDGVNLYLTNSTGVRRQLAFIN